MRPIHSSVKPLPGAESTWTAHSSTRGGSHPNRSASCKTCAKFKSWTVELNDATTRGSGQLIRVTRAHHAELSRSARTSTAAAILTPSCSATPIPTLPRASASVAKVADSPVWGSDSTSRAASISARAGRPSNQSSRSLGTNASLTSQWTVDSRSSHRATCQPIVSAPCELPIPTTKEFRFRLKTIPLVILVRSAT